MSCEYFGRLIATGEWVFVCYLPVKYVTLIFFKYLKVNILSLDIKYMMFVGVSVQEID